MIITSLLLSYISFDNLLTSSFIISFIFCFNLLLYNCFITSFTNIIKLIFKDTNIYINFLISNDELTVDNINFFFINFCAIIFNK